MPLRPGPRVAAFLAAVTGLALAACSAPSSPSGDAGTAARPTPGASEAPEAAATAPVVVEAAGDVATGSGHQAATADILLRDRPALVLPLGDNAYSQGTLEQFQRNYDPSWGRLKARTRPVPGNHEYGTAGAAGYKAYFGAAAIPQGRTYYSYDVGAWHLVALDSNLSMSVGSPQQTWLRDDLRAVRSSATPRCIGAYWHHPRYSSGSDHGSAPATRGAFQTLYSYGAAFVLSGHEHNYERFAPQDGYGRARVDGVRQFVVGTGGAGGAYPFAAALPNSQKRIGPRRFGVLRLTLGSGRYAWEWVGVAGEGASDRGSASCRTR